MWPLACACTCHCAPLQQPALNAHDGCALVCASHYNWGIHRKRSLVSVIASLISLILKFLHAALLKRTKVHANECCELREVTREVMIVNIMPTAVTTHPMTAMASHVVQVFLAFSCVFTKW